MHNEDLKGVLLLVCAVRADTCKKCTPKTLTIYQADDVQMMKKMTKDDGKMIEDDRQEFAISVAQ